MKAKLLCLVTSISLALAVACGSSSNNDDGSDKGGGGSGGKASGGKGGAGGSGGKASGGAGGKAAGGSGGSSSGGTGGSASGGTGGTASGGAGGTASGGAGGMASGGAGGVASGGAGGMASGGAGGMASGNNGDTAEWNFEQQVQLWKSLRGPDTVKLSTATVFKGNQSLELPINVTEAELATAAAATPPKTTVERGLGLQNPGIIAMAGVPSWSGKTITFHVWVPTNFPDGYFTAYILGGTQPWKDSGFTGLNKGGWTTVTFTAPAVSDAGQNSFLEMGLYFNGFSAPWTGSIFVDSVEVM
ncbi:MAG: hypothetical protein SF187_30620 [Deltaproteobacteria bacterium]|nr:hypothetical protein [Deltaproteobacteria bacterium]